MRRHLRDGALAGLAGGAALASVLLLAGERSIAEAIRLEQRATSGVHDEVFSRGTQQAGGVLAALIWGLALGAIFAVAYLLLRRFLAVASEWRASVGLAVLGFVTVNLVPLLKYPANPPAVGDPDTIGSRTGLYLVMVAWSFVSTGAAWRAARVLGQRAVPEHVRCPAVVALYLALVVTAFAALPGSLDAVTAPATLVWRFRVASLAGTAAFWAVCGTVFGWLRMAAAGHPRFSLAEEIGPR